MHKLPAMSSCIIHDHDICSTCVNVSMCLCTYTQKYSEQPAFSQHHKDKYNACTVNMHLSACEKGLKTPCKH